MYEDVIFTQEDRLSQISFLWTEDLLVFQILLKHYGEPCLIEGFHDNRSNGLVIGKEVKNSKKEEEKESQPETKRDKKGDEGHFLLLFQCRKQTGHSYNITQR